MVSAVIRINRTCKQVQILQHSWNFERPKKLVISKGEVSAQNPGLPHRHLPQVVL